eukprot:GHVU01061224.1.p1 GENE.GHVU01061224.1~~GHVU01061224.1.p1  ORF type:complete len:187 (+),score=36.30 GHVU01061224.1:377-937(+)
MQEMYLVVFCCRYIDLFWSFISVYNSAMKVVFICSTAYLIYLMRFRPPISLTYSKSADSFPYALYLIAPAVLLSFLTTEDYTIPELMWTFSIWLESVAILPQLVLLQQLREVENLTSDYVAAMGLYRALYVLNWVYRYFKEGYYNWIGWIGGLVQTALYVDFFFYYAISKWYGRKMVLPLSQEQVV